MKKTFLLIIFICSLSNLYAQTWAPVGAKWTYSFSSWGFPLTNSPVTIQCVGDTIIQGKACRILHGNLACSFEIDSSYLYCEDDKIFMYIDSVVGFHVLYDFTVSVGNSWTIIAPGNQVGDTSEIVVDSIVTKIINGDTFSVQYVHNLNMHDRWVFPEYIIKEIGNKWCFFPLYSTCDPWTGPIRCYEDSTGILLFSSLTCDTVLYYDNIMEYSMSDRLNVYPNPATNVLNVEYTSFDKSAFFIEILSSTGCRQLILTERKNNFVVSIDKLHRGLYFIKLTNSNGKHVIRKFIKE
ncbi:MAG: T9SS type A sorting domain-containing protein [Bacteroidetes bacterium]|nr:T9SS type A sorting domain-containing protein [Bacteroidota bacterium]